MYKSDKLRARTIAELEHCSITISSNTGKASEFLIVIVTETGKAAGVDRAFSLSVCLSVL